jgi:spore maturation protein CgeB
MLALHWTYGFRTKAAFVPIGATRAIRSFRERALRIPDLAFVASPTANRRELLARIPDPIAIFGRGWQEAPEIGHHKRETRRIDDHELADIYASHMAALNIKHGLFVINGLNQRHFAPYIEGTPVVSDAQPDIPLCFDPGTEMLVYRDSDELCELYAQLRREPGRARALGRAGQRRVMAHHTYAHRLQTIADLVGERIAVAA